MDIRGGLVAATEVVTATAVVVVAVTVTADGGDVGAVPSGETAATGTAGGVVLLVRLLFGSDGLPSESGFTILLLILLLLLLLLFRL